MPIERIESTKVFEKKKEKIVGDDLDLDPGSGLMQPQAQNQSISDTAILPADDLEASWEEALNIWGFQIWLSMPEFLDGNEVKEMTSMNDLIAFTDLMTRQVIINKSAIEKFNFAENMTEIMSHEIGHHFRYPHTMQEVAALQVIQEKLLPDIKAPMFLNLFEDLLINKYIGDDPGKELNRRRHLTEVYEKSLKMAAEEGKTSVMSLVFLFYLAIYEAMWKCKIITHSARNTLRFFSPVYAFEAEAIAKDLWTRTSVYHKFIYFCTKMQKYLEEDSKRSKASQMVIYVPSGSCAKEYQPDTDDVNSVMAGAVADAITDAIEDETIRQPGQQPGNKKSSQPSQQQNDLDIINRLSNHRPGHEAAAFRKVLVSKHYQRLVNDNILKIPPTIKAMEKTIPSVLEDWDWGDSIKNIDWNGSIQVKGPLASIAPQKRDLLIDDGAPEYYDVPAIEIYIDTSGSMPNPQQSINAMTLAGMILAASAIRHKGMVKAIIYSSGPYYASEWMRDELACNDFLLHYIGGGTDYPFEYLQKSCAADKNVVRVIISDSDFIYNLSGDVYGYENKQIKEPRKLLDYGIENSKVLVAMLYLDEKQGKQEFASELLKEKFKLVTVQDLNAYAKAAGDLAAVLFDRYGK